MATKTSELISMVESLPTDIRTQLVEKILNSLNPSQKEIDALRIKEVERRVKDLRTGKVKTIPGEDVFREIKKRANYFDPSIKNMNKNRKILYEKKA